ncbi:MAG: hypothetical protein K0V04_06530 [Deltaproteobacteria bacterium]|nr:hypothetical protein [Deltaproteobacteria bacterium]
MDYSTRWLAWLVAGMLGAGCTSSEEPAGIPEGSGTDDGSDESSSGEPEPEPEDVCGDGVRTGPEECDGTEFGSATCASLVTGATGQLTCTEECSINTLSCVLCGNGVLEGNEACDGFNFGDRTCETEGFDSGTLQCGLSCSIDLSGCELACGNGVVDEGEDCDTLPIDAAGTRLTCEGVVGSPSFGDVECGDDCLVDVSGCSVCGDGVVEAEEQCDGEQLAGVTCDSLGLPGGEVSCTRGCVLDASGCTGEPVPE